MNTGGRTSKVNPPMIALCRSSPVIKGKSFRDIYISDINFKVATEDPLLFS